jgi:uncharacterized protein
MSRADIPIPYVNRVLFRKGANFVAAMAFEIASTNLVVELGIILALLMGWQFAAAEFVGGPIMIVLIAVMFRIFVRSRLIDQARAQAERGLAGSMEGHAAMDMSVQTRGSFLRRLASPQGFTSVSHVFVMEGAAIYRDIIIGLLLAGAASAWVPQSFWQSLFLTDRPDAVCDLGPHHRAGGGDPGVRLLDRQRTVGRGAVERRHQLWRCRRVHLRRPAGVADPQHLPQVLRHEDDVGAVRHLYVAMVGAGYLVEILFSALDLVPKHRNAMVMQEGIAWNYTTWLNIAFLILATALFIRFIRTGGISMLKMMGGSPDAEHEAHEHHHHGGGDEPSR